MKEDGSKKGLRATMPCCRAVISDVSTSPTEWSEIKGLTETLAYSPALTLFNSLLQQPAPWFHTQGDERWKLQGGEGWGQIVGLRKRDDRETRRLERRKNGRREARTGRDGEGCGKKKGEVWGKKPADSIGWKEVLRKGKDEKVLKDS